MRRLGRGIKILFWFSVGLLMVATLRRAAYKRAPYLFRKIAQALGVKEVRTIGEAAPQASLMVANHISYADILVLGSVLPCRFISKSEVRNWPVVGWIATRLETIFISRKNTHVRAGVSRMQGYLGKSKRPILIFPEGTTSDGCKVLPFRSSFFELTSAVWIQPISLKYSHVNGLPAPRSFQKILGWRGEVSLFQHLKWLIGFRHISVTLIFHPPFLAEGSRKRLSHHCFQNVQRGFESL